MLHFIVIKAGHVRRCRGTRNTVIQKKVQIAVANRKDNAES